MSGFRLMGKFAKVNDEVFLCVTYTLVSALDALLCWWNVWKKYLICDNVAGNSEYIPIQTHEGPTLIHG